MNDAQAIYDGLWNEAGTSLKVIIRTPPWFSWYAWILYAMLGIGLVLLIRRYLVNRAKMHTALEVERIEKEKALELDQMKSRFFTNISHEFRTPLTLILGTLREIEAAQQENHQVHAESIEVMKRNAGWLQKLIDELLDISKLESGEMHLRVCPGNLASVLKPFMQSFSSLAAYRKINFRYHLPEQQADVWLDQDKLEKILANLISNALKFTDEGGKIQIDFTLVANDHEGAPEWLRIKVADSGRGIPKEKLSRIFDRFYQANNADNRDAGGSGIGLALTRELVELYRGEIHVKSTEGRGSTFSVTLPVAKNKFRAEEISEEPGAERSTLETDLLPGTHAQSSKSEQDRTQGDDAPLILVVEDHEDLRNFIIRNLDGIGRTREASNGEEGLERALGTIPDLVISDLMMPGMDGMEMCRRLKEDPRTNHIPVIILTAKADRESKLEGLRTGADAYLTKPFDAEELQVRVAQLIDQRNTIKEKFRRDFLLPGPPNTRADPADEFTRKLLEIITAHYTEFEFSVEDLGASLHMSRAQLFRKVRAVTGESPNELLRMFRIRKAAQLLRNGEKNITSIMYEVGFQSTSHFARIFKRYLGKNPSEYRKAVLGRRE